MKTTAFVAFCLFCLLGISSRAEISNNWSGYGLAASGDDTFTAITGIWNVPTVTANSLANTYASFWIGINGLDNSDLVQCGVACDITAEGFATYTPWWEVLPATQTNITTFDVNPGDMMSASIVYLAETTTYQIILQNLTAQANDLPYYFSIDVIGSYPNTSAEWIAEAPTHGGEISTLANYGSVTFSSAMANLTGTLRPLSELDPIALTMVQDSSVVSIPGAIVGGDTFTITYVPEPSTWALMGIGVAIGAWQFRRKRSV